MKLPGLHSAANPRNYHFTYFSAVCEQQRQKGFCVTLGHELFHCQKASQCLQCREQLYAVYHEQVYFMS